MNARRLPSLCGACLVGALLATLTAVPGHAAGLPRTLVFEGVLAEHIGQWAHVAYARKIKNRAQLEQELAEEDKALAVFTSQFSNHTPASRTSASTATRMAHVCQPSTAKAGRRDVVITASF